jgi:type II secretory pathway predicted ATPase ExeA
MSSYLKFFELKQSPFEGKAQSQVVLGTQALRDAFGLIQSGLEDGDARICVSGGAGLGKTSLARALPKLLGESARVAVVLDPDVSWESSRGSIAKQWGVESGGLARAALIDAASDRRLVLVIDQAERASEEFLDHLDVVLSYRSENDEPVVQSILLARLSGSEQAEPAPIVWWLDRIHTLQLEFAPLPREGITSYIRKHLKRAGWQGEELFSDEAALAIHGYTGGIPGEISTLCERLLAEAAALDHHDIDAAFVDSLCGGRTDDATAETGVTVESEVEFDAEAEGGLELNETEISIETVADDSAEQTAPCTIELQEVVAQSTDIPTMLDETLEQFADDAADVEKYEEDGDDAGEDEEEIDESRPTDETGDFLSAPASPEELRLIIGGVFGRQARAFAAAAIAAVIGGLAFAWMSADVGPAKSTTPDRQEIAGLEPDGRVESAPAARQNQTPPPILARLRGPVLPIEQASLLAGSQPEALQIAPKTPTISEVPPEDALFEAEDIEMHPAAMLPGSTGESPFETDFQ